MNATPCPRSQRRVNLLLHGTGPAPEFGDRIDLNGHEAFVLQHRFRNAADVRLKDVIERRRGICRANGDWHPHLMPLMKAERSGDRCLAYSAFAKRED